MRNAGRPKTSSPNARRSMGEAHGLRSGKAIPDDVRGLAGVASSTWRKLRHRPESGKRGTESRGARPFTEPAGRESSTLPSQTPQRRLAQGPLGQTPV